MANRQLTPEELERANALLAEVRSKLEALSQGDKDLLFAYRRKLFKELTYDERRKPMVRRVSRIPTSRDSRLIHQECDVAHQASKGYA